MEKSDSQKIISDQIITENPKKLTVSISDSEFTIIMEAGGFEAAYTADEARDFMMSMLSMYHQRGWGENIVPTADYIFDLANVLDNDRQIESVEEKWDHDGEFGDSLQYEIVADTGEHPIMSFNSKGEAMSFCEDWNKRPPRFIEYHLEKEGDRVPIWNLTETEGETVAEKLEEEITELIRTDATIDWEIAVNHAPEMLGKDGVERIFRAGVWTPDHQNERYRYQIYYAIDGKGINTSAQPPLTQKRRVRIDRQRGRMLEAMSKVPKRLGLYIGQPDANLEWLTFEQDFSPDQDFP